MRINFECYILYCVTYAFCTITVSAVDYWRSGYVYWLS